MDERTLDLRERCESCGRPAHIDDDGKCAGCALPGMDPKDQPEAMEYAAAVAAMRNAA